MFQQVIDLTAGAGQSLEFDLRVDCVGVIAAHFIDITAPDQLQCPAA